MVSPKPVRLTQQSQSGYAGPREPQPISVVGDIVAEDLEVSGISVLSFNTNPAVPQYQAGNVFWDELEHTLSIHTGVDSATLQVGQELYVRSRNSSGSLIGDGVPVKLTGSTGNRPTVAPASQGDIVIGMTTHVFPNNTDGLITTFGLVRQLDTSAFADGDTLYLTEVPGVMSSSGTTRVGYVIRAHNTQGMILLDRV